ncbi:MAG: glycerophosphodiester phosphodiesterase [Gammaproteobacteria bacterium]|nr:glycerophosphodiester phosphodiesterase [Gammaproteobacteria bacterium]
MDPKELDNRPQLVAHRGYAGRFPENTLESVRAALDEGALFIEIDVQLTSDLVPVLLHDVELDRTAGRSGTVTEMPASEVLAVEVNETARLGSAFNGVRIPRLNDVVSVLQDWPHVTLFVEIKKASLKRFGTETVVRQVVNDLAPIRKQSVVISFDRAALEAAREMVGCPIGWGITQWTGKLHKAAQALSPEYLFCNHTRIPVEIDTLWPGPWRWVLYEADNARVATRLARLGAHFIETMQVGELFHQPPFRKTDD